MVFTKPFLYLSVLNFTCRTPRQNRLFRVSKSRNGASRGTFNLRDKTVRNAGIISLERDMPARNNLALAPPVYSIRGGGSFTVPLGQVHFMDELNDTMTLLETAERRPLARWLKPALGYLLAAAGLIWVLHDVHPAKLLEGLTGINWRLIALALVCDVSSYVCQGWRWRLLLQPVGKISTLRTTQAIYVGLFTNEALPMRIGELGRAWLVSRWVSAKFMAVIPSIVVERLFDGVWVATGIWLTASFAPLPKSLIAAGETFGAIIILAVALFVFLAFRKRESGAEQARLRLQNWKPLRGIALLLERLGDGLRETGRTRAFYLAFALSPFFILLQILAYWLVMLGYGLRLSFWLGVAVFLIVHLGTAIPNAPANAGSYQFFTVLGLTLFGVDKTRATGFSLVAFALLTLPLLIIGFLALSRSGMSLAAIREELRRPASL